MAKKGIIALIVLLQLSMMLVAEKNYSDEGIDILLYKENVVNGSGFRDHSISADITGHTLTIEGLRTTDNGLLTRTKTKTKAKVFSNSFGLSQQPSSSSIALAFVNSHGQQSTDYKLYTINYKLSQLL